MTWRLEIGGSRLLRAGQRRSADQLGAVITGQLAWCGADAWIWVERGRRCVRCERRHTGRAGSSARSVECAARLPSAYIGQRTGDRSERERAQGRPSRSGARSSRARRVTRANWFKTRRNQKAGRRSSRARRAAATRSTCSVGRAVERGIREHSAAQQYAQAQCLEKGSQRGVRSAGRVVVGRDERDGAGSRARGGGGRSASAERSGGERGATCTRMDTSDHNAVNKGGCTAQRSSECSEQAQCLA